MAGDYGHDRGHGHEVEHEQIEIDLSDVKYKTGALSYSGRSYFVYPQNSSP